MPEQLDLFTSVNEQEKTPVEKASEMLLERRLKPPAVIMQNQGPDIVVPRIKENNSERTASGPGNFLHPAAEKKTDSSTVTIPDDHFAEEDHVVLDAEKIEDSFHTEDIPVSETVKEEQPVNNISEITPIGVPDISEPIAIIAVRPATEKPKTARGRKSIKEMSMEADLPQVPEDEKLFSKQYYGIGEVATMFQVNASLLRYWESEFDVLKPRKNGKGDRFFRPEDIKNLQIIHHLLRQKKFTIQGAKDYLRNNKQSKEKFEMVKQLQQLKAFLLEMKAGL